MSRAWPVIALSVAAVLASTGCDRRAVAPAGDLPPAYTRDKILDPKLAEVARAFTAWAGEQKVQAGAVFGRVEVLPRHRRSCPTASAHTRSNCGCRRS